MLTYRSPFLTVFLFACTVFWHAAAQEIVYKMYTRDHGLPSSKIYQVLQDSKGFIWTCSENGISRFDGIAFRTFTSKDGFSDFGAFRMYEDYRQRIWLVTFTGNLVYFDEADSRFHHFSGIDHREMKEVRWVDGDLYGNLYFFTGSGSIFRWKTDHSWQRLKISGGILVSGICLDNNKIVVTDNTYIYQVTDFSQISRYKFTRNVEDMVRLGKAGPTQAIGYNAHGIYLLADSCRKVVSFEKENQITCLGYYYEPTGDLWVCASNGLYLFENGIFDEVHKKVFFKDKNTTSVIRDFEGNYWISVFGEGLAYCFSKNSLSFSFQGKCVNAHVGAIASSGHTPYVFLSSGEVFALTHGDRLLPIDKMQTQATFHHFKNLLEFKNGDIWVFGSFGGYKVSGRKLEKLKQNSRMMTVGKFSTHYHDTVAYLCVDAAPTFRELQSVTEKGRWGRLFSQPLGEEPSHLIKAVAVDKQSGCWMGCHSGLYYFDAHTAIKSLSYIDSAFKSYIADLWTDDLDRVWVATKGSGILCLDHFKVAYHFTTANGLSTNNCTKIFIDDRQDVWVCTSEGLNRIIRDGNNYRRVEKYTTQNLMPSNEVSCVEVIADTVYAGTDKGLVEFHRGVMVDSLNEPKLNITAIRISGKEVDARQSCSLHDHQNLAIEFVGISYRDKEGISYRYKLDGLDEQWHYTLANKLEYSLLPPGSYHFILQTKNSKGNWSAATAGFALNVMPAFWQTVWFKAIIILAVLMIIFGIIYIWFKGRHKAERINRKIVQSQLQSLRLQINPHFIFNSINSIQDFIFAQEPEQANLYLSKFAALMRMIIENSKKELVPLQEENHFISTYLELEQLRFSHCFDYDIIMEEPIEAENVFVPPMLIQPIVENAVKHGLSAKKDRGVLHISYRIADGHLLCSVEDNGIGRKQAAIYREKTLVQRPSVGLANITERLQLLSYKYAVKEKIIIQDLYDESGYARGTRVNILLPLIFHQPVIYDTQYNS